MSNVARAYRHLDGYGRIKCYLDNDAAGRRTLEALLARYGGRVSDCSGIYDGCKDLNEHLQRVLAERQAQSENEKKNKSIRDLNEHLQRVLAERLAQSENEKKNKSIRL